jgi:hypothetical protein
MMNGVHERLGFPRRVRETPFGTVWECERGWALFAHESRQVDISLPRGDYNARMLEGEGRFTPTPGDDGRTHLLGTLMARGVLMVERAGR